jgi:leucyl aminopeptidase
VDEEIEPMSVAIDVVPSIERLHSVVAQVVTAVPSDCTAVGWMVGMGAEPAAELGTTRAQLLALGFEGKAASTCLLPGAGERLSVAVGIGDTEKLDATGLREAAGAFARAAERHARIALWLPALHGLETELAAQSIVEGVLLARYRYDVLRSDKGTPLETFHLVITEDTAEAARLGAARGMLLAGAQSLSRDLAAAPPAYLAAPRMAEIAESVGHAAGLDVEVFERQDLERLGCGGLLGVNQGSAEEPRMIKLSYTPQGVQDAPHLGLVGKGIMYDSGGVSLKPSDVSHSQMKNDMSGAGAILAAMAALPALICRSRVTGWLMCTDNMLQGSALKLGDVLTFRNGKTAEIINTDAEGRLVMADGLALAVEEGVDAIVDIATLTGACLRALGPKLAGVIGNDTALVDAVKAAGDATDERVWELPLDRRYRTLLDSEIADVKNHEDAHPGATTAALFLQEFVGDVPWAHLDIAGTAWNGKAESWRPAGVTGFGARLLIELALAFHGWRAARA